jgi:hypothetical protein
VLHHAEPGHVECPLDLAERPAVLLEETVEDRAARRVGQRPEHGFVRRPENR